MHILTILRMYLGISQTTLARQAGITQPDLSEMETLTPYGHIDKYQRVARALGLPVDPIMKNEPRRIPLSFFKLHPPQEYLPLPKGNTLLRGRKGEGLIFAREQARLMDILPVRFYCAPKKELTRPHITGFAYYRRLRGLKEREIAEALELSPHKWSLYETGKVVPSVPVIMKASDFLDASVDHLLATYEVNRP